MNPQGQSISLFLSRSQKTKVLFISLNFNSYFNYNFEFYFVSIVFYIFSISFTLIYHSILQMLTLNHLFYMYHVRYELKITKMLLIPSVNNKNTISSFLSSSSSLSSSSTLLTQPHLSLSLCLSSHGSNKLRLYMLLMMHSMSSLHKS